MRIIRPVSFGLFCAVGQRNVEYVVSCYALALLDLSAGDLDEVCGGAAALLDALKQSDVRAFFANPAVSARDKVAMVREVGEHFSLSPTLVKCLCVVIGNGRCCLLCEVIEKFFTLLKKRQGGFDLELVSAVSMSKEEIDDVVSALGMRCGQPGNVMSRVDPEILGGFIAKVGFFVVDASFVGCLRALVRLSRCAVGGI